MMDFKLTEQQQAVVDRIGQFMDGDAQVFILRGYAGTGKTTIVKAIAETIQERRRVVLMAPTGRAARVLTEKTGIEASTIHRAIYGKPKMFENKETYVYKLHFPLVTVTEQVAVIIDEASMLSSLKHEQEMMEFGTDNLMDDLLTYARPSFGGKLIFVGDPAQLPPVGETESQALNAEFFETKGLTVETAELTEVMRQKDGSVILDNAMLVRDLLGAKLRNRMVFREKAGEVESLAAASIIDKYFEMRDERGDYSSVVIGFSNKTVADYNRSIRLRLFGAADAPLHDGEILMVAQNNYSLGKMNGEFLPVVEVGETTQQSAPVYVQEGGKKERRNIVMTFQHIKVGIKTDKRYVEVDVQLSLDLLNSPTASLTIDQQKALYINFCMRHPKLNPRTQEFEEALLADPYFNCLRAKYGYAVTGHKCQGGEWSTAFVDYSGRTGFSDDCLRWTYTATTRARQTLYIVNLPHITPFTRFRIDAVQQCKKFNPESRKLGVVGKSPFHSADAPDYLRAKYLCVQSNFEYSPFSVAKIESRPYLEIYYVNTPNGIERYDIHYKQGGIFAKAKPAAVSDYSVLVCQFLDNENAMPLVIDYEPADAVRRDLYRLMQSAADTVGVQITNVVDHTEDYSVSYYLRTSGTMSYVKIYINKKGAVTYAKPMSLIGQDDKELARLIDAMKEYFV